MEFLEYFWPDNPVAKGVVIFLICLFVVWLTRLVSSFVGLWVFRARAEQCADVEILSEALQGKADQDEESSQKEVGNVPDAGPGSVPLEAESAFFKFCQETTYGYHLDAVSLQHPDVGINDRYDVHDVILALFLEQE